MAVKKTKKLSGQSTVTTINNDQKFPVTDANGKVTLISLANLKTALLAGMNLNGLYDGIFIMYHRKSDDYPLMVKPHKWTSLQNSGEIADGVVVVEGGKIFDHALCSKAWPGLIPTGFFMPQIRRILIVDDDPLLRLSLAEQLNLHEEFAPITPNYHCVSHLNA